MPWSKCHKNCVITGPLDAYCLVCERHIKSEDELDAHFEMPIHKKNLESTQYFLKYRDDRIRKVKKGYYCEFCNLLLVTAAKVGLHIVERQHQDNKSTQLLRRVNNMVYAFDTLLIGNKEWNGFVDDTCTVCNVEFENESIHKSEQNHTLNLILKKIEFIDDKLVYRKIDKSSYQCLTCNLVLATNTLHSHVEQDEHIRNLQISRAFGHTDVEAAVKDVTEPKAKTKRISIVTPLGTQESNDNTDRYNETIVRPSNSGASQNNANIVSEPRALRVNIRNNESNKGSSSTRSKDDIKNPKELEKYITNVLGAVNYIIAIEDGKSMCLLCYWCMDTDYVAAHVGSRHHVTILKLHTERLEKMANGDQEDTDSQIVDNQIDTDEDKTKILDSLTEFQNNDININFEINLALCKKCSKVINLVFDDIQRHIHEHKKTGNKMVQLVPENRNKLEPTKNISLSKTRLGNRNEEAHSSRTSSVASSRDLEPLETFATQNNLIYKNGTFSCPVCESQIPMTLKNLQEHVLGAQHQMKIKETNNKNAVSLLQSLVKVPTQQFITSMIGMENSLVHEVIINETYNINIMSFLMITSDSVTLKCQACEVILQAEEVDAHKVTETHINAMSDTMVVTSITEEFVREPRPNVFHCGVCSKVAHGLDDLEEHLTTTYHRGNRNSASWRLREHLSLVARERWQCAIGFMAFMNMLTGNAPSDHEWN